MPLPARIVQVTEGIAGAAADFPNPVTVGNTIIVATTMFGQNNGVSLNCADSLGNSYTKDAENSYYLTFDDWGMSLWSAPITAGGACSVQPQGGFVDYNLAGSAFMATTKRFVALEVEGEAVFDQAAVGTGPWESGIMPAAGPTPGLATASNLAIAFLFDYFHSINDVTDLSTPAGWEPIAIYPQSRDPGSGFFVRNWPSADGPDAAWSTRENGASTGSLWQAMVAAYSVAAPAGPNYVDASASLSGAGDLAAAGTRLRGVSGTLTGSGSLTGGAVRLRGAAAALSGAGGLAAAATRLRSAAAAITASGALTAVARAIRGVRAVLSGTGSLTARADSGELAPLPADRITRVPAPLQIVRIPAAPRIIAVPAPPQILYLRRPAMGADRFDDPIWWPTKHPAREDTYGLDFAGFLDEGETITGTPEWSAPTPSGITIVAADPPVRGSIALARVSGGQAGQAYRVTCTITTSATPADVIPHSVNIRVKNV